MKKFWLFAFVVVFAVSFLAMPVLAKDDVIKIAIFEPLSGPFKYVGETKVWGLKFHAKQWNEKHGGLYGKKIEILAYDSQLKPDVAVKLATKAILKEKVHILAVGTGSHVAQAMMQLSKKYKKILITFSAEAASLTGELCNPYHFRVSLNTAMHSAGLAAFFEDKKDITKFGILCQDYNFGREAAEGFKRALKKFRPDAEIVMEDYHPLANKDFAPYITKVNASKAQVIFTANWGPDLSLLIKQGKNLGMKSQLACYYLEDGIALADVQDAADGHITCDVGTIYSTTEEQKAFNKDYHAVWKEVTGSDNTIYQWPGLAMIQSWHVRGLFEAAAKAGKWDVEAIIKAFEGLEYQGLNGKVVMRAEDHQLQAPATVIRIDSKAPRTFDESYPQAVFEATIPADKISIPLSETGCGRKAGQMK